jgi:glutathionylspermidine synthase
VRRITTDPRPNWRRRVEEHGLAYHTAGRQPYWDESACYQFTAHEIDTLEHATNELHRMCLELVQEVIDERLFGLFLIPAWMEEAIVRSWEDEEPSVYGRFDLAYDGVGAPRLLEYNADTPIALLEASITQWVWLKDADERAEQFNAIDERLIDAWAAVRERHEGRVHFAALSENVEDFVTTEYLRDTALRAGLDTVYLDVRDIGWDARLGAFVDRLGAPITRLFKLYPWELMVKESFGPHVPAATTRWVEPPWKMILAGKSILPLLYERHPDSPFLLPASFDPLPEGSYVRKPVQGREGMNLLLVIDGKLVQETHGPYVGGPYVYQAVAPMKAHDGRYPVIGSWVAGGTACGIGIREDDTLVTGETCRFVPHVMVG